MSATSILAIGLAVLAVLVILIIGLYKAAAKGNVYCPTCGSENCGITIRKDGLIVRICNVCGCKW